MVNQFLVNALVSVVLPTPKSTTGASEIEGSGWFSLDCVPTLEAEQALVSLQASTYKDGNWGSLEWDK